MRSQSFTAALLATLSFATAQGSKKPGYDCYPDCIPSTVSNGSFSFGQHYAVLNLDLINAIVGGVAETPAGKAFISNVADWIDTVHAQDPPPLSIFTRIYFSNSHKPEVGADAPFYNVGGALGTAASPETELYPAFTVNKKDGDVVLQKTRYYAGAGNALEQILATQNIDTVILSGIRSSGVILSTAYRLFDLDYNVYVVNTAHESR